MRSCGGEWVEELDGMAAADQENVLCSNVAALNGR